MFEISPMAYVEQLPLPASATPLLTQVRLLTGAGVGVSLTGTGDRVDETGAAVGALVASGIGADVGAETT